MYDEPSKAIPILLVEDSPSDAALTIEALQEAKVENEIHHVVDGVEAINYLRRQGQYANAPRPGVILLDLNLPRKDGREVLAEIKNDANLKSIPVVVLTTSQSEADIMMVYGLHANCYITKPVDFAQFAQVIKSMKNFWFRIVQLPIF